MNAIHQMRERGWLSGDDGLLKGAKLAGVKFDAGMRLPEANNDYSRARLTSPIHASQCSADLREAVRVLVRAQIEALRAYVSY